ncbi:MAG: ROK family protein [Trueperaceae bacterium]|nr:ROK family protein [Trueperaceae bacterium]MCC6311117.1 ROK family protein [Trueperaceae bacterium]MCO5174810.1 ROK family protein [Trueperaceae bacterium]MCW5818638.1 ROK family protein [Trueperaceae bacterium]
MAQAPVLAMDVGGTKLAVALVRGAEVVDQELASTPANDGPEAVVAALGVAATSLLARAAEAPVALGVACAGLVRAGKVRAVSRDLLPGWDDFPLVERLERALDLPALGLPVVALNDAQAAAYGEALHGAGRGRGSSFFVTVSTGVGGGFVVGDRLWQGATGLAGHLGHMGGGVLERMTSGTALERRAAEFGHAATAREIVAAADERQPWARGLLEGAAAALAAALVDVKYVVDPEVIVLGGGVGLNPAFRAALEVAFLGVDEALRTPVLAAELGAAAGLVGAAAWAGKRG